MAASKPVKRTTMIVPLRTVEQLKEEFFLAFRNNCGDKVTKVTNLSVINGFAFAISKLIQKINNDAAILEVKLFPEHATGSYLDEIASREGVSPRYGASKAATILLFVAEEGTVYPIAFQVKNSAGVVYQTNKALTIPVSGFGFVEAESLNAGTANEVLENSLTTVVTSPPAGHISVMNTVRSVAKDEEEDFFFRSRIVNVHNVLSMNTEAYYEATIMKRFPDVVRVEFKGHNSINATYVVNVLKNNGNDFTVQELNEMVEYVKPRVPLSDTVNESILVENYEKKMIDVFVPATLDTGVVTTDVLRNMQIALMEFLDPSKWLRTKKKVEWVEILDVCRSVSGVREILETTFLPHQDILISPAQLPRLQTVVLRDLKVPDDYTTSLPSYFLRRTDDVQRTFTFDYIL